jgi:hypothetical protein
MPLIWQRRPAASRCYIDDIECIEYIECIECIECTEVSSNARDPHQTLTVKEAIETTLPKGPHQRHRRIFDFARALRFDCGLGDAGSEQLRRHVIAVLRLEKMRVAWFQPRWWLFAHRRRLPDEEEQVVRIRG